MNTTATGHQSIQVLYYKFTTAGQPNLFTYTKLRGIFMQLLNDKVSILKFVLQNISIWKNKKR